MNAVNIPGFSADAALYETSGYYSESSRCMKTPAFPG
jgi:hypothetical protein